MRTRSHFLLPLAMTLLVHSIGLAQGTASNPDPLHFKDFIDWYNSIFNKKPPDKEDPLAKHFHKVTRKVCIDGQYYNVTELVSNNSFGPTPGLSQTPLGEDCSESTDTEGNPALNPGS